MNDTLWFCPQCFASEENGSAGQVCDETMCYNCGGASTITLPRWAIESIREQASWVGKRFYPTTEDRERTAELEHLRARVPDHPTDKWSIEDWAKYSTTPQVPDPRLELTRAAASGTISTSRQLPRNYTEADVEIAKRALRVALPISHNYFLPAHPPPADPLREPEEDE